MQAKKAEPAKQKCAASSSVSDSSSSKSSSEDERRKQKRQRCKEKKDRKKEKKAAKKADTHTGTATTSSSSKPAKEANNRAKRAVSLPRLEEKDSEGRMFKGRGSTKFGLVGSGPHRRWGATEHRDPLLPGRTRPRSRYAPTWLCFSLCVFSLCHAL